MEPKEFNEFVEEMAAVVAHFKEMQRRLDAGEKLTGTEEDARWVMRYDAVNSRLKKLNLD